MSLSKDEVEAGQRVAGPKYYMSMNLNVLNSLGIKLYSNTPAVLSEAVANSWDADAVNVKIEIGQDKITIEDDGCGMDEYDINNKYLLVGFRKRDGENGSKTPIWKRDMMGRKGIGKLSLFSVANVIEVQSMKNGKKNGFILDSEDIEKQIKKQDKKEQSGLYVPTPLPESEMTIKNQGTIITLRKLKKSISHTTAALRKRLARRFSIISPENNFIVKINGEEISAEDRDYFNKLQFIWYYGEESKKYVSMCNAAKLKKDTLRYNTITCGEELFKVTGWIATTESAGDLKVEDNENLNGIVIMVREKLAQEDVLKEFNEGGIYASYLIGEVHADFFDLDDRDDLATSNRQEIIKDDQRYESFKIWLQAELKEIQNRWSDLRSEDGAKKALEIQAVEEWFNTLGTDDKKDAKKLFGKIGKARFESDEARKTVLKWSIMAFESFRFKNNLKALENIRPEDVETFGKVFTEYDDIEATLYHQIVEQRLAVIDALKRAVDENSRERVLQEHIFNHLWLLDPHWERATGTPIMEQNVKKEFDDIDVKLSPEEKKGRMDIKYKETSGKHVIIELKRANVSIHSTELQVQVDKYRKALKKCLESVELGDEPIEIVCVLGKPCKNWDTPDEAQKSIRSLREYGIRIILYNTLIDRAYRSYKEYLEQKQVSGRIRDTLRKIDEEIADDI